MADGKQLFLQKNMYRRPKFLEILLDIRREMAAEADHDVELFAELARSGKRPEPRLRTVSRSFNEPFEAETAKIQTERPIAKTEQPK